MKKETLIFLCFNLLLLSCNHVLSANNKRVYIVYMGSSRNDHEHDQLVSSLMKRLNNAVVQSYRHGFSGFAARLSDDEARAMAKRPGVVSVFPDPVLKLHTTHSWEFLKYQTSVKIDSTPRSTFDASSGSSDTIIGILDTGIWPESKSFMDVEMGPIPTRWKGKCMEGLNFTSSNCNRKLIGARYYYDPIAESDGTPRDQIGHGTHVASTAAGTQVPGASYYGLANGTAEGGSSASRIAMYRVCSVSGCLGSAILKAFDDAIADGVDVLSLSLGSGPGQPDFVNDPIAIGSYHAVEKGIAVVCSAGNDGATPSTAVNVAPWIITVAATTIDRDFEVDLLLGGGKVIKGQGINFSKLNKSPNYPLADGASSKSDANQYSVIDARNCVPGSLDDNKVKGKIVLCENNDQMYDQIEKFEALKNQSGVGMILVDDGQRQVASNYGDYPILAVSTKDGADILSYIKTNSNPVGTMLPTVTIQNYKPAPAVGYFSARGPTLGIGNLLKPDIAAPGVAILAAWPSNVDTSKAPVAVDSEPPGFNVISGTSMSCPHVSGLVAAVKSQHPTWSPSAIKSAIMTTAIQTNNLNAPITTETGSVATPYDIGAGEIMLSAPLQPGLVYETETDEYLQFLCSTGYDASRIKIIASSLPSNFSCPNNLTTDSVADMNYPSIGIQKLRDNEAKTVKRTVTNVGEDETIYTALIEAPSEIQVEVVPNKLQFTKNVKNLTFQVTFKKVASFQKDLFGSITWSSDKYKVRSPFVVGNV